MRCRGGGGWHAGGSGARGGEGGAWKVDVLHYVPREAQGEGQWCTEGSSNIKLRARTVDLGELGMMTGHLWQGELL